MKIDNEHSKFHNENPTPQGTPIAKHDQNLPNTSLSIPLWIKYKLGSSLCLKWQPLQSIIYKHLLLL